MRHPSDMIATLLRAVTCSMMGLWVVPVDATDVFYGDVSARSPNGHYRLDAKSPGNQVATPGPFQGDFAYTLTDVQTGKVAWSRSQPKEGEASPKLAWVDDTGWVVVRTGWDQLVVFSPTGAGQPVTTVRILDQFPKAERDSKVRESTAGPMWSKASQWYFLRVDERMYFVVRAWWGRRVILDLAAGTPVADAGKLHEAAVAAERTQAVGVLEKASKLSMDQVDQADAPSMHAVAAAVRLAGRERIKEVVPFLREIETWDVVGTWGGSDPWFNNPLAEGSVNPFEREEFNMRFSAQTALRRLGETPQGFPATRFRRTHAEREKRVPVAVTMSGRRADHVDGVKAGMLPLDVLRTSNAPDALVRAGRSFAWEYDIDSEDPFTLRVHWTLHNPPTVSQVERLRPPLWKDGDARDDPD